MICQALMVTKTQSSVNRTDSEQDMRKSDYDHVLEHAKEAPEIVLDNDGELEKCREFR